MIIWPFENILILTLAAVFIEIIVGYPNWLMLKISHPIVWLGSLIKELEKRANKQDSEPQSNYLLGLLSTIVIVSLAGIAGLLLQLFSYQSDMALILSAILTSSLFASRSLWQHVNNIHFSLIESPDNLEHARSALSRIVSRETSNLDTAEVSSSAIESLSENASDAVLAPIFWCLVLGLPGLFIYKAINTLDSMWGYRNRQYEFFGKFPAKFDDIVNWLPARFTALGLNCVGNRATPLHTISADARQHPSPNAGWPEAAIAYALDIRLGGDFNYSGAKTSHLILNEAGKLPAANDISRALRLYSLTIGAVLALLCGTTAFLFFL